MRAEAPDAWRSFDPVHPEPGCFEFDWLSVCMGIDVPFEPPSDLCQRLREHTRNWIHWTAPGWHALAATEDPWGEMLDASGRARPPRS